jgi:phospholipase C
VLLVTYDEQGGFYDHVAPPATVSPGDTISDPDNNHHNFDFAQLGVRVPAIVISPLIPANVVDHTVFDHTSLLATIENLFGLPSLTQRDSQANTFSHLLSLQNPRTDAPTTLPDPADSGFRCEDDAANLTGQRMSGLSSEEQSRPIEPTLGAFLHVAFLRDYHHANLLARPAILRRYIAITNRTEAVNYIREVAARVPKPKKRLRRIKAMIKNSFRKRKEPAAK